MKWSTIISALRFSQYHASDKPLAGFEPVQTLNSDSIEETFAVMRTITPRHHYLFADLNCTSSILYSELATLITETTMKFIKNKSYKIHGNWLSDFKKNPQSKTFDSCHLNLKKLSKS